MREKSLVLISILLLTSDVLAQSDVTSADLGRQYDNHKQVGQYKLNQEMGCREEGARNGASREQIAEVCGCVSAMLNKVVPESDWKSAADAAFSRDEKQEMQVMSSHFRTVMADCRATTSEKRQSYRELGKTLPVLAGTWVWKRPANGCVEQYKFTQDGKVHVTSGEEVTENTSKLDWPREGVVRHPLTLTTIRDSGGKDCAGSSVDDKGKTTTNHAFINYAANLMLICTDEKGWQCFGPLIKR